MGLGVWFTALFFSFAMCFVVGGMPGSGSSSPMLCNLNALKK
jgi:hypothetical protein